MRAIRKMKRILAAMLVLTMVLSMMPMTAFAAGTDAALEASLAKAKTYIDGITINNSKNDPATVVKNFKTHFTWDNEKRESSKSYLFDWSYYNGVVFEGIEYVYEVTGDQTYRDYVIEYMSSLIASNGTWATCSNNSSKQCAGYDATHGADCYKTASLLVDAYQMTGDNRYLTMANTLYADLDKAAKSYSLSKAGNNFRHTWATDPSPDLWLDGLYMILPFRAEYAKYIGDTEELDLIVSRLQWVSDNMYNSSKGLFYHAADSATSNSGTFWLRSIGWYAAALVDVMDHMSGSNLTAMQKQLVKLVDGMKACQNASNGMWLNNMAASKSSSNPYETSGTALVCYAVMKAVNNGWLDDSYADMAILAFNGICNEKLSGSNLTDICFKGVPGSSNSTFYDNEGKGVGPFIMLYAEVLEYVNDQEEEIPETTEPEVTEPEVTEPEVTEPEVTEPEVTEPEVTEPEVTEPEVTEPEVTEPEVTEPEATEPEATEPEVSGYQGTGNLVSDSVYTLDSDGINSGSKYLIVYSGKALQNNNGVDSNPSVSVSNNTITLKDDSNLAWVITQSSGSNYYVENNGSYVNLNSNQTDPIGSSRTVYITRSGSTYTFRNTQSSGGYLRYSSSQLWCVGSNNSNNKVSLYRQTNSGSGAEVVFKIDSVSSAVKPGESVSLNGSVTVDGKSVSLSSCTVAWASSNKAIATVSGGKVTGVAGGNVTITATLSAVNGTALKENIVLNIPVAVQDHAYKAVVTAPTCTEGGYTTYTCTNCGDSYVSNRTEALGHSYKTKTVGATCDKDGSVTHTCACGHSYSETIPATGHDYADVVTAPTCETAGYITHTCKNCGDTYVDGYSDALGHSYKTEIREATCTEDGYTAHTCAACGHSYVTDKVDAPGHSYEITVVAPTCTEEGYTVYTCSVCYDGYFTDETKALGHDYDSVTQDATCTEGGYTTHTCGRCGDSYVSDKTAALGHDNVSVITEATCETAGYTTHTCTVCGAVTVDSHVDALGHDNETLTVEATCTKAGSVTITCRRCGDSSTEVIEALGHDYKETVNAPTCETAGCITHTCVKCGDTYVDGHADALGHSYETVTKEATCTENGAIVTTCTACGDSSTEVIKALGHSYKAVVTVPTCTKGGYTTHTCGTCGDSYVTDETKALGHDYDSVTVEPTCTGEGYTAHTCGRCGDSYVSGKTGALGHSYSSVEANGYLVHTCDRCGDSYSESVGWVKLSGIYTLDTDGIDVGADHKYIVVGADKNYALTLSGSTIGTAAVTVKNNTITLNNASAYEFYFVKNSKESGSYLLTQNGTKGVYHSGGNMYYGTDNKGYWHIGSASNGSYQLYDYDNQNWYLNYGYVWASDSVSRFAVSSNARSVRLFKAAEGFARLSGEVSQTWNHADGATESAVLQKVVIQLSGDGSAVSGTAALTSDMISWDKTFDGVTAGTYTATVTYQGVTLGTVTVVITGEHTYDSVVTAPTCTEGGHTVHTCTECGVSYESDRTGALGHSYSSAVSGSYLVYTCERCGDSYSEKLVSYSKVSSISSGKSYVITFYSGSKYYALSHANNQISVVQVTVSGGEITSEITEDLLWKYSGSKLSYVKNGSTYYLYAGSSNNWWGNWWGSSSVTLQLSTSSSSTVSFSSSKLKVGSYYLRYSGGSVSVNSSASTVYMFVEG